MSGTVLIIDDSPTIRYITKVYLSGLGVDVREAVNGRDGLAAIDAGGIDLVIADLNMPEMNGEEFVRQLRARKDPKQRELPVILMTMEQMEGLRQKLLAAGANQFLTKPVSHEVLRAAVLSYLPGAAQHALGPAPTPEGEKK